MADEPADGAAPEAEPASQQPGPVDELAKGLPDLPVESRRWIVDEAGFHGKGRDVPWANVLDLAFAPGRVHVLAKGKDGRAKRLLSLVTWWRGRRSMRSAWREYLLRGTARNAFLRLPVTAMPLGAALVLVFCVSVFAFHCAFAVGVWHLWSMWRHVRYGGFPNASSAVLAILSALVAYNIAIWLANVVTSARLLLADMAMGSSWQGCRLTPRGLVIGGEGDTQVSCLGPDDTVTGPFIRVGGRAVPTMRVPLRLVAIPLILALGERAGARLRLGKPWWMSAIMVATGVACVAAVGSVAGLVSGIAAGALCAVFFGALAWWLSALQRRQLADGRAMLERLGW